MIFRPKSVWLILYTNRHCNMSTTRILSTGLLFPFHRNTKEWKKRKWIVWNKARKFKLRVLTYIVNTERSKYSSCLTFAFEVNQTETTIVARISLFGGFVPQPVTTATKTDDDACNNNQYNFILNTHPKERKPYFFRVKHFKKNMINNVIEKTHSSNKIV